MGPGSKRKNWVQMNEQGEIGHEDEENHLPPPRGMPQEGLGQAAANAQLGKQEKAGKT